MDMLKARSRSYEKVEPIKDWQLLYSDGRKIRDTYGCFPDWTQPIWTWLTGKPRCHEIKFKSLRPATMFAITAVTIVVVSTLELVLLNLSGWLSKTLAFCATPFCILILTGEWRKIQVVYMHHAIHDSFFNGNKRANSIAANVFGCLAFTAGKKEYQYQHMLHHSTRWFAGELDSDATLLRVNGFYFGRGYDELRRCLILTILSPFFHFRCVIYRVRSVLAMPVFWRIAGFGWWLLLILSLTVSFGIDDTLIVVIFPLFICFHVSALLQILTEHLWLPVCDFSSMNLQQYAVRCVGRFCGEAVPSMPAGVGGTLSRVGWFARLLFVHLPTRVAVLVGDLPAHDWHHLSCFLGDPHGLWPCAIYARQQAIDGGRSAGMEYREIWGMPDMIRHALAVFAGRCVGFPEAQASKGRMIV